MLYCFNVSSVLFMLCLSLTLLSTLVSFAEISVLNKLYLLTEEKHNTYLLPSPLGLVNYVVFGLFGFRQLLA